MALTLARPVTSSSSHLSTHSLLLHRRLISFTSITQPPSVPSLILGRRSQAPLSHAVGSVASTGFTAIRCKVVWDNPSDSNSTEHKAPEIQRLQDVKPKFGSYNEIGKRTGLTNVYVAQLLRGQAKLKPDTEAKLKKALPELSEGLLNEMKKPEMKYDDPEKIMQEPTVCRLSGAVLHFGESIKEIINEEFGGGITSAIDFCSVDKVKGEDGKDRVKVTFMWP